MDFSEALSKQAHTIRGLQIIVIALVMGAVSFVGVVAVLTQTQPAGEAIDDGAKLLQLLSLAHLVMAPSCWMVGFVLYRTQLNGIKVHSDADAAGVLDSVLGPVRNAAVLTLALFEGPALFGVVIVLIGHVNGTLAEAPYVWAGLLSTAMMVAAGSAVIPTKRRLEQVCREVHQKAALD